MNLPTWGVTFSIAQAQYYGYDWKVMYLDMLNDLQPKKLRLLADWTTLEPEQNRYNFQPVAEMMLEAQSRNIDIILVLGHKQPRWPGCHHPAWYENLTLEQQTAAQLSMVKNTVNYYKQFNAIKIWQLESEPLSKIGNNCPALDPEFVRQEIELIRTVDSRPILLSVKGESGGWLGTSKLESDILGTSMYRVANNSTVGYFKFPIPAAYFHLKAGYINRIGGRDQKIIATELQAEPWFIDDAFHTDLSTQRALMNAKIFNENVDFARDVGFDENYLWGVEWWYWLAHQYNDWGMWEEAKAVLK